MTAPARIVHVADGDGTLFEFAGTSRRMKVTSAESEGQLTAFVSSYPDGVAHPLHIHHDSMESFFLLEGAARFVVDGEVVEARAGDFVSVPRGAVHGFVPIAPGTRALVMFTPSAMEGFWEEVAEAVSSDSISETFLRELSQRHNVESIGPFPADQNEQVGGT